MAQYQFGRTTRSDAIRRYLIEQVKSGKQSFPAEAEAVFGVSRQTIASHLRKLVSQGYLDAEGRTRRTYRLGQHRWNAGEYDLSVAEEHRIYANDFSFVFEHLPESVREICDYGFTEILNNAIDHSEGDSVYIEAEATSEWAQIVVNDDGEGIFKRIARILGLNDPRESLLELSKGKMTTDPDNHTGEGIFFTSRAFDRFIIRSGDLDFAHVGHLSNDYLLHVEQDNDGTTVGMRIDSHATQKLGDIFDSYSSGPDEYRFEKTVVPVRLALYEGESLVSRSQAKRLLNRVERFRRVILDFEGVAKIGQAFADEVFRVFANKHAEIQFSAINMTDDVQKMVARAQGAKNG